MLLAVTVENRGADAAPLHVLPQVWFRNTWSWRQDEVAARPARSPARGAADGLQAEHRRYGVRYVVLRGQAPLLFTENETNNERLYGDSVRAAGSRTAIDDFVVQGATAAINPRDGTKAAGALRGRRTAGAR